MKLLPADRFLIQALREAGVDLTDEDYCAFRAEVRNRVVIEPGKPQAGFDPISAIVMVVIGIGLQIAASFLKPQQRSGGGKSGRVNSQQQSGEDITANQRFAPRVGFDSFQQPATLGTTIPVIYAKRQTLGSQADPPRPAGAYGGVRVNTPLIWSQMLSIGGGQMLRGIFMLGESCVESLDYAGFAVGNNSLGVYELQSGATSSSGRLTFYYRPAGGRITSGDYVRGRAAASDIGNAVNSGGQDVFAVRSTDYEYKQDFCYVSKPSTSTQFGLYSLIPNRLAVRINPRVRPTRTFQTKPDGDEKIEVDCEDDPQALAELWKSKYAWSARSGITGPGTPGSLTAVSVGDTFTYRLTRLTDAETEIKFNSTNTDNAAGDADGSQKCGDVASIVSGRQRAADDALSIGELYKAGSALAVLVARQAASGAEIFVSDSDNAPTGGGQSMTYTFQVVRAGTIGIVPTDSLIQIDRTGKVLFPPRGAGMTGDPGPRFRTATGFPQIFKCAIANVIAPRETRVIEIGLRSAVGITVNGFCNFRDCPTITEINDRAGNRYNSQSFSRDQSFNLAVFQSGSVTTAELRYSFFNVYYRNESDEYVRLNCSFGVRSMTSQAVYNYLRLEMPTAKRWEFKIEPVSGWEVRTESASIPLLVIDSKSSTVLSRSFAGGITARWNGVVVERSQAVFSLGSLDPKQDIGLSWTEDSTMTDSWGRVAEAFVYQEIQSTAISSPEHEIVYINCITENPTVPLYENISILGLNIRAATEWQQFGQLSAYVTGGRRVLKFLGGGGFGASSLFPDILRDLMLNTTFGAGGILSVDQVDSESFIAAAQWCQDRRYFYDGAITDRTNLRQWAADVAASMLLDLIQRNGKFCLEPAVVFDGPVPIKAMFTAGNIVEGTFQLEFLEEDEREPIQASVKWREERARESYTGAGFFPVEREVLVREASRPDTDSIESFDLSDYCTNLEHAIDFACYVIRMRRIPTHSIKFATTPDGLIAGIAAGDYIKVAIDYAYYDEFANGIVLPDGRLISTTPDSLPAGTYPVVAWAGGQDEPFDTTLTVDSDGLAQPTAIAFVRKIATSNVRTYKIETLSINQNGEIEIEAVHHPTDSSGYSEITKNWTTYETDSNWIIQV